MEKNAKSVIVIQLLNKATFPDNLLPGPTKSVSKPL